MMNACCLPLTESEFKLMQNHLQIITVYFGKSALLCAARGGTGRRQCVTLQGEKGSPLQYALSPKANVILPNLAFDFDSGSTREKSSE